MKAFEVTVGTTNSVKNTSCRRWEGSDPGYFHCDDGKIIVVTDDPRKIYSEFGLNTVKAIREIGYGYTA